MNLNLGCKYSCETERQILHKHAFNSTAFIKAMSIPSCILEVSVLYLNESYNNYSRVSNLEFGKSHLDDPNKVD